MFVEQPLALPGSANKLRFILCTADMDCKECSSNHAKDSGPGFVSGQSATYTYSIQYITIVYVQLFYVILHNHLLTTILQYTVQSATYIYVIQYSTIGHVENGNHGVFKNLLAFFAVIWYID